MTLEEMADAYAAQMAGSDKALDYYTGMGLSSQVIAKHQLGWIIEPLVESHAKWEGMPVVPYIVAGGTVVALRANPFVAEAAGRYDLGYIEHIFPLTAPKWRLYNVGNAMPGLRTSTTHLVETVEEVLVRRSNGERAVAVPGFQNFYPWWAELFMHSEVIIHSDGSKPEAVREVTEHLRKRRITFTEQVDSKHEGTVVEPG